ncbi:MAG: hypothetical protein JW751_10250, partial [Polyangiaceae bacterium]|nr:hypothetical protein [Polyangiaceae bacterium]
MTALTATTAVSIVRLPCEPDVGDVEGTIKPHCNVDWRRPRERAGDIELAGIGHPADDRMGDTSGIHSQDGGLRRPGLPDE